MGKRARCMTGFIMVLAMLLISFTGVPACAESLTSAGGYTYEIDAGGNAVIIGYEGSETELVIPAVIDRHPVTAIGDYAFDCYMKDSTITSVVIPAGITSIGNNAFSSCTTLNKVTIPSGVTTIGASAFLGCDGLTEIEIPDSVTSIGKGAFCQSDNLKKVKLGNGLTKLEAGLFVYCPALESIEIPDSVTEIGSGVFCACTSLKNIKLPSGLTTIGGSAFAACESLQSLSIPPGVTSIESYAFAACTALKNLVIPPSVASVGECLFDSGEQNSLPVVVCYPKGLLDGDTTVGTGVSYVINPDGTAELTLEKCPEGTKLEDISIPAAIMGNMVSSVKDPSGADITKSVSLEVPFTIESQPADINMEYGSAAGAKLTVGAKKTTGTEQVAYQWYENDTAVSGAAAESYEIPRKQKAGTYIYYCEVTSGGYRIKTEEATVSVAKKKITVQADSVTRVINTNNPVFTYTVPAGALVEGDTTADWNVQLATEAVKASPAGEYPITGTITAENYDVTVTPGLLTVVKKMPTEVEEVPTEVEETPKKGDNIQDSKNKAVYKVLKAGTQDGKIGAVSYIKSVKKAATVTVPATIKVEGITYRVEEIAKNAFKNNKKITKVTIGKYVKKIGASAFYNCAKLKTVKMGASVSTIGDKAFYKCKVMTKITIPAKVTKIGKQAFYGCKKLKTITVKTKKLKSSKMGKQAFKGIYAKAVIKVPKSKYKTYKSLFKKAGAGSKTVFKKN